MVDFYIPYFFLKTAYTFYYLYASQKITIKDTDSKDILLNDEMIKGAKYSYTSDSKGAYQVYEEIELTKDGQAKLNELLNDYALLATDVAEIENAKKASESESTKTESTSEESTESTENTEEQNTESTEIQSTTEETSSNSETTKKTAKLYVNDTTYDVSKIEKGKINPSYLILKALAKVLPISLDSLINPDISPEDDGVNQMKILYCSCPSEMRETLLHHTQETAKELTELSEKFETN